MFKRREKKPILIAARDALWPRTGWSRAFQYVKHRINRLPDRPQRIARGIAAGVFISFTPFFGLHFFGAAAIAWLLRGNMIASILGTFFGNPLTFPIIAVFSTQFGRLILGQDRPRQALGQGGSILTPDPQAASTLGEVFARAGHDLVHNFWALFTPARPEWGGLHQFFSDVWLPYLVGGLLPGLIAAVVMYYVTLPFISAYQNRRRAKLKERLEQARAKLAARSRERSERRVAGRTNDTAAKHEG
ncbi:DUF2062 domain-containing protein [Thioclava sp. GXIMD4216]|uniref:DUF2062 domain-containing protein n=1 Tax=Thioclava litoralis TaxID=3076557 RepID=A0ABZ1E1Q5_9RHOB|nr:DUF2062 domain-containing protein [Thioclava sp. FTW29]